MDLVTVNCDLKRVLSGANEKTFMEDNIYMVTEELLEYFRTKSLKNQLLPRGIGEGAESTEKLVVRLMLQSIYPYIRQLV